MNYDIQQIFNDLELDLIASLKKSLEKGNTGDWQKQKLQALSKYKKDNIKIINKYTSSINTKIAEVLKDSFVEGANNVDEVLKKIKKLMKPDINIDTDTFFKINEKRINALINAIKNDLDKAQRAMLRQADDVYRQTIFKSQVYLNSDSYTLEQSVDLATKEFLEGGYNCITYKDGRKVNIASYAEMALRTSSQRAVFAGEGSRRNDWGVHTVIVSQHSNCSKPCLDWQGRVYIDDVYSDGKAGEADYSLLSTAMNGGLFHPNCRHNMSTYFEGISSLPEKVDNEKALNNYESEQKQRYMERQVRKYKRIAEGSLDSNNSKNANNKVKEWQGKLRQHIKDNPQLRRDYKREQDKITSTNK